MTNHAWCRDVPRDEAVRAAEESAPAVHRGSGVFDANGDEVPWEGVVAAIKEERDAAIRERDAALAREACLRIKMESAPAASGAANSPAETVSAEPVAWGVTFCTNHLCFDVYLQRFEAEAVCERINSGTTDYEPCAVVPLFASPPPARGWLMEDEQALLSSLADHWKTRAAELERPGTWGSGLPSPKSLRSEAAMLTAILARSTPLEVVLPKCEFTSLGNYEMGFLEAIGRVKQALVAAGVTVTEGNR